jgi:hypothetical protein
MVGGGRNIAEQRTEAVDGRNEAVVIDGSQLARKR